MCNVNNLLTLVDTDVQSPTFTASVSKLIEDKLNAKAWQPNTVRVYLNSLRLFLAYLRQRARSNVAGFSHLPVSIIESRLESIKGWNHSLHKKEKKARASRQMEESAIDPDTFGKYFASNRARQMEESIENLTDKQYSLREQTDVRNHLIVLIVSSNCCRLGPIKNMILTEFYEAEKFIRDEHHVVRVMDHKTVTSHGAAEVVMSRGVYGYVKNYVKYMRPASQSQNVFLAMSGSPMDSSTVVNGLTQELRQGCPQKAKITCTRVRHLGVSLVHGNLPEEEKASLANHMAHSQKVAAERYSDLIKAPSNVRSSKILSKLMRGQELQETDLAKPRCGKSLQLNFVYSRTPLSRTS